MRNNQDKRICSLKNCKKESVRLPKESFYGRMDVRGYKFTRIYVNKWGFLYEKSINGIKHYEVFRKVINTRFLVYSYPHF
jgi:hypothetical protein